jgi:molybdenum cofactor biosynthesis protein B
MPKIDEARPFIAVRIAVLAVSDTRRLEDDRSGAALAEMISAAGHELADRAIVKDEVPEIRAKVQEWIADPRIDAVITTGGTGFTGRDVTPEAVKPLFEKEIDGFSTVFHMISFEKVGTSTIQSRACGGVAQGTYVFCLPGSPGACRDAWNGILKWQLDNRHRPCNFVEIMPRLEEHRRRA